jgi:peptide/nickel transport system permease protein
MKKNYFSFYFFFAFLLFIFLGDVFYTISPFTINPKSILEAPSFMHLLGTDRLGRDLLARIIEGGKVSLFIGIGSALIASFLGLIIGTLAGYYRGFLDKSLVLVIDLFLTFPTFFLLLTLVSYIKASAIVLIIVISTTGWMTTGRLIRSESFAITQKPYIKILNIANIKTIIILFKYYLPLLAPIFLVSFTFGVGGAILAESGLSFLGLGITAPNMSWGTLLSEGKELINTAWWMSFFPGLMIFIVTMSLMNISDILQKITNQKKIL